MRTFFSSDHHFGHKNIIRLSNRPFEDLHAMHKAFTENWNAVVGKDDLVYVLGDFSFSNTKDTAGYLSYLNGRKILIAGNHDKHGDYAYIKAGFEHVFHEARIKIAGRYVNLSHFPYAPKLIEGVPPYELRYMDRRPHDDGRWLLHGHTHSSEKLRGRQIHIGVDAWNYKPVPIEEIESIIALAEKLVP